VSQSSALKSLPSRAAVLDPSWARFAVRNRSYRKTEVQPLRLLREAAPSNMALNKAKGDTLHGTSATRLRLAHLCGISDLA
jgi:hypothetical protein